MQSNGIKKSKKKPALARQNAFVGKQKVFRPSQLSGRSREPEEKAVDVNVNLTFGNEDSTSLKIYAFQNINQGPEAYQRIGRSIRVRKLSVRGIVYCSTSSLPPNDVLTMLIVYGTRTQPSTFTNLYNGFDYTGVPTGTTSYRQFNGRDLANTDIWKVLWRKDVRITDIDEIATNTRDNNLEVNVHIPCDILTKYDNTPVSGFDGSIVSGGVWFIVQGLSQGLATSNMHFQGSLRCTFTDS